MEVDFCLLPAHYSVSTPRCYATGNTIIREKRQILIHIEDTPEEQRKCQTSSRSIDHRTISS